MRRIVTVVTASLVAIATLAIALGVVFVSGVVPLSGFEARIASALRDRLGTAWNIDIEHAEISRTEGRSLLLVRDISFKHSGGTQFRAPEAVLGYEPLELLRGDLKLNSIELRGLNVRVGIDQDGGMSFDTGADQVRVPAVGRPEGNPTDPMQQMLGGVMAASDVLTDEGGPLARLQSAGLTRVRLTLIDPAGHERIGLDNVNIQFRRNGDGRVEMSLKGAGNQGQKDIHLQATTSEAGDKDIRLDINQLMLADFMLFGTGTRHVAVTGIPVAGMVQVTGKTLTDARLSADVRFGKGSFVVQDSDIEPVSLDSARIGLESRTGLGAIEIQTLEIASGDTRLSGKASALIERDGALRLQAGLSGQIRGEGQDKPVTVSAIDIEALSNQQEFKVSRAQISGPGLSVAGQGVFRRVEEGHDQKIELNVTRSDARSVLALWPRTVAPLTRRTTANLISSGVVNTMRLVSDIPAAMQARMRAGEALADSATRLDIELSDTRLQLLTGLPPLMVANATAVMTGQSFSVTAPSAMLEQEGVPPTALTEGQFSIANTWASRPVGKTSFRARGEFESLLKFLSSPVLRPFSPIPLDVGNLRGATDLKANMTLPLDDAVKASEVAVQVTGSLSNLSSDTLLGGEKLDNATLAVSYDKGLLTLKGEGRVGGEKAQIDLRQPAKGPGEASISLVLDQAARQKRGFGFDGQVSGPIPVKLTKALGAKAASDIKVEADLSRAAIEGMLPGWSKPAGRPGKVSLTLTDDGNGYDFEDFLLDSSPVLARGKISLDKKNAFESASLSSFRLSPGDDLKVEAAQDGSVLKLTVRGAVADARPFLKDLSGSPERQRGAQKRSSGPDVDIDLAVPILTGFNSEAVGNASLKLSKRGKDMRALSFDGRIGRSPVSAKLARRGEGGGMITVTSANGGALLRYLDLYRRAFDGDLSLTMTPDDDRQSGEILLRDFVVRNEPALRRVISEQSAIGDRTGNGPVGKLNVEEVEFTKLRAGFVRTPTSLEIKDAVLWGKQVGFNLQGRVDYARDRIDIAGTFIPGFAFNNAFSQVPIFGRILGGGQNEGLFAVNFRLNGAASAPSMTVNPLSALAPGILRKFIDPFGGSPREAGPPGGPGQ